MMRSSEIPVELADAEETGKLGLMYLKRYWSKTMLKAWRKLGQDALSEEWGLDNILLSVIGVGVYQVSKYLYEESPTFEQFEDWVVGLHEELPDADKTRLFNDLISGSKQEDEDNAYAYKMTERDWEFWNENGYLIIRNAVPEEDCIAAINVICEFLEISLDNPSTWYKSHDGLEGIMVQLFQHPVLQRNRESAKVKAVYQQLYGEKNLWLNTDKVGFNPPETDSYKYRGIGLHWDTSLALPIPLGLQGILYLTNTSANQGAFTCVPQFQNKIEGWLGSLPPGSDPRRQDLNALGPKPIAAEAGDFIVWHHALPHGASANTAEKPRFVQYISYISASTRDSRDWI